MTLEDIRVIDGHHFVAVNFNGQVLHDDAPQILSHGPVGILAVQRDREGKSRGPGDNHVMLPKVGEPDKQLLVLVDAARLLVVTTDCRTLLTPRGSWSDLYGLSLRPNLLEAIVY